MRHYTINVNTTDITIVPVSDVQVGAAGCAERLFKEHVEYALAQPNPRFVGVGDYTDGVSPSNRRTLLAAFEKGDLYDTARDMLDDAGKSQAARFLSLVRGTKGKWDVLLKGHHFWQYRHGHEVRTTDHDIALSLDAPYAGGPDSAKETAVVTYTFPPPHPGGNRPFMRIYLAHGEGGGKSLAMPLNQAAQMMCGFNAEVYIVAHHHRSVAAAATKLDEDVDAPTQLKATDARLVGAGSWLRGYMPGMSTYAEDGMMTPLAIGAPIIRVHRRKDGTFRIRAEV